MKVAERGERSRVRLDDYADLLAIRSLPEYRFVDDQTIECATALLAEHDLAEPIEPPTAAEPSPFLFDYQQWLVSMAVDKERFAIFSTTGTGKTACQLDWARIVTGQHGGRTLIVAPLAVVPQTIAEAAHFYGDALPVADLRERAALEAWLETGSGVGITNYEKIDRTTDPLPVGAVVLDESSVLKNNERRRDGVLPVRRHRVRGGAVDRVGSPLLRRRVEAQLLRHRVPQSS